ERTQGSPAVNASSTARGIPSKRDVLKNASLISSSAGTSVLLPKNWTQPSNDNAADRAFNSFSSGPSPQNRPRSFRPGTWVLRLAIASRAALKFFWGQRRPIAIKTTSFSSTEKRRLISARKSEFGL